MTVSFTLAQAFEHAEEIRKSRFIVRAAPVSGTASALAFVADAGEPAATHNVWAYRVGGEYRFNDDGEPAGTAGRPVLQAIDGQALDRVAVVVTRWYGGIKLGAGGLVRAYGGSAAECLRLAPRVPIVARVELQVSCDFGAVAILKARCSALGAECLDTACGADGARMRLRVAADAVDDVRGLVRDVTRGRGLVARMDLPAA
ncbi:MAG: YigZ family protein [Xanthomonadales bacterium]|nr:YigZ family protein [Xanthomonadales bacterium]